MIESEINTTSRSTNNQLKSNNACLKQYDHLEEADTLLLEDIAVDIACGIAEQVLDPLFWVAWETLLEKPRNEMQDSDLPSEYERIIIVRLIMDCLTDFLTPLIKAKRRFGDKVSLRRLIKLEWRH